MQTLEEKLKLQKPLAPHVTGILSLVIAAQEIMVRVGSACERHGLTRPQYNVLRVLRGAGLNGHARHAIAARMVENAPDVTRILDRLVRAGCVERARAEEDRRESVAKITKKGLRVLRAADKDVSREEDQFGSYLKEADWLRLAELCKSLFPPSRGQVSDETKSSRRK